MNLNPKTVQLVGDALIPLMGLFLWDWSLYFILLFYFIDLLAAEIILHLKSKKTVNFQSNNKVKKEWIKWGAASFFFFLFSVILTHFSVYFIVPGVEFQVEALSFWNYEEMGVKQGYILVPLVLFVAYQQYRMTYLVPGKYKTTNLFEMWKKHIVSTVLIIAFAIIALVVGWMVYLPETVYVLAIIIVSTAYKYRYNEF